MRNDSSSRVRLAALCIAAFAVAWSAFAQTISLDVVTINATVPDAVPPDHPGVFTIARQGDTSYALYVFYHIGGTASNGVDYAQIPNDVVIPAGSNTVNILIEPKTNSLSTADKTVELQLSPSLLACPSPPCGYDIGSPSNATVVIHFSGSNTPPVVRIISPPNGAVFFAPLDIPLFAYANDVDGFVSSVEFFDGSNSLGFGHAILSPVVTNAATDGLPPLVLSNLFLLVWSNPPTGPHALTAKATDNDGLSTVSDVVNITIEPGPPPPSNAPPLVNIVATDPVAIEGTNCWPWVGLARTSSSCWSNWTAASPPYHIYTNCGPKNASFTVHRHGVTNQDLTVSYAIDGTASNGVEYVALPGSVTIPAGERNALITIVPMDDGPPDLTSTVVLKLTPSTNVPPDYLVGSPRSAVALILDGPSPRPSTGVLPDKRFHVAANGPDGAWFHIEYSTDLVHWVSLCTNQVVQGSIDFIDPDAPVEVHRFYRAVPETTAPSSN
jgi:hypothetical protein